MNIPEQETKDVTFVWSSEPRQPLPEAEEELAAGFRHPMRQLHFRLGREAAHRSLEKYSVSDASQAILIGSHGQPIWPEEYCGSISHTKCLTSIGQPSSVAGCVTRHMGEGTFPGLDIEWKHRKLSEQAIRKFSTKAELQWIEGQPDPRLAGLGLLAAKEALYKALFPVVKRWFGFTAAEVLPLDSENNYQARLLESFAPHFFLHSLIPVKIETIANLVVASCFAEVSNRPDCGSLSEKVSPF